MLPHCDDYSPLTIESCREYISTEIFKCRPETQPAKAPQWPGMVGVEVEMLLVQRESVNSINPRLVPLEGDQGLFSHFRNLASKNTKKISASPPWSFQEGEGSPKVTLQKGDQFTFEPGGQLEYSSNPYRCLSDMTARLSQVQNELDAWLTEINSQAVQLGMNPWHNPETIQLQMTKPRYQAMNSYFKRIGKYGQKMMRQTCSIQINLDFGGTDSALTRRFLAANLLAPFTTAIFANSPIDEGKVSDFLNFRSHIWQNIDKNRTGFPELSSIAKNDTKEACIDAYLQFVLDANVVFVSSLDFRVPSQPITFKRWLQTPIHGIRPLLKDFITHLSLQFPEVRPKGFMEIRSVDGQSRIWQTVPVTFYSALLYDDASLEQVLELLLPDLQNLSELWLEARFGLASEKLRKKCQQIMEIAIEGVGRLPACYQCRESIRKMETYHHLFTSRGRTPADDLLDIWQQHQFTPTQQRSLEERWSTEIS